MGNCASGGRGGAPGAVKPVNSSVEEIIMSASYAGEVNVVGGGGGSSVGGVGGYGGRGLSEREINI